MPMFKVKDLMINVGDTPQALCLHTTVCGICSVGGSICQCSVAVTKVCQDCTIAISQLCANCSIYISKVCRQETITNCYDTRRPNQGISQKSPEGELLNTGAVYRRELLGGLINDYSCEAA